MEPIFFSRGDVPCAARHLAPGQFLREAAMIPVLDVRSPSEFRQGHIPGARNLPLFSDEERAIVGTTYARNGKEAALLQGLDLVGPKLSSLVNAARETTSGSFLVHCWRGGMRSEAMAWLLQFAGFKIDLLQGGYKAYRKYIREALQNGPPLLVLGGMTGSGKTELLRHLGQKGEQVVDLEALAHHKGSAFGALGQLPQPSSEQFENDLAAQWLLFDPGKPVWVEDESMNIGKVVIPDAFYARMREADLICLDVPFAKRLDRLVREYGSFDPLELIGIFKGISRRIGNDRATNAVKSLSEGDVRNAAALVLNYYDKTYLYGLGLRKQEKIVHRSDEEIKAKYIELKAEILNKLS